MEELRASSANLHAEQARIEKELEALTTERQWLITQDRKGSITTTDMEQKLSTLTMQEISLKRELSSLGQAININALNEWEAKFSEYLADLRAGIDELKNAASQSNEERHQIFLLKKQTFDTLVERVIINKNREIKVEIRLNLLTILDQGAGSGSPNLGTYSRRGEIYTHMPDLCHAGIIVMTI